MSTLFSVNLNKLALIRNSRGSDYPNLQHFMKRMIELGVRGFTVHPRPDERHIKYQDCRDIKAFLADYPEVEFNIEGNPIEQFLALIREVKPHQCTLVPDSEEQLTSDHGYDIITHKDKLSTISSELAELGTRCSVFVDPDIEQIKAVLGTQIGTIEIYTADWAHHYPVLNLNNDMVDKGIAGQFEQVKNQFGACIRFANKHGIRTNAGHDLNLLNLAELLALGDIEEVSIGHAFTIECIEQGIDNVVEQYLRICE